MRLFIRRASLLLAGTVMVLAASIPQSYANTHWSFTSNDTIGLPGATVGWGYTIANLDSSNWLSLTGLNVDPFSYGTPQMLFDFPIIAPNTTLTVPYDGFNGLYEFTWDTTAPMGFVNTGTFTLSAEWYSGDPFAGGAFIAEAPDLSFAYSATVAAVPVPAAGLLFVSGLLGLRINHLRRQTIRLLARCLPANRKPAAECCAA